MKTTLYYKGNGSDKVYTAEVTGCHADGYHVDIAYGRRGSTMQTGRKNVQPIGKDAATALCKKLIAEKMAKGYTEGEDGVAHAHTPQITYLSNLKDELKILPMLLNPIECTEAYAYLANTDWLMQQKHDGERRMVMKSRIGDVETIYGINRKGNMVDIPMTIHKAVNELDCESCLLDGEIIGDVLHVFDLLEWNGYDMRKEPCVARYYALEDRMELDGKHLRRCETATSENQKKKLFPLLRKHGAEGAVFKRKDSQYKAGRPNSGGDALKCKFWESATFLVKSVNAKRSISVVLNDGTKWVDVGNCTIPPNHNVPSEGKIVEIRYLYAYAEGSIYQPVYLGERNDIDAEECTLKQLKIKGTGARL